MSKPSEIEKSHIDRLIKTNGMNNFLLTVAEVCRDRATEIYQDPSIPDTHRAVMAEGWQGREERLRQLAGLSDYD